MQISQEKINDLNALLKIKLVPEDYEKGVDKRLREYRKNARIPGFRPGNVPMGVVKKMAGRGTLIEEVNKVLSNSIYNYIMENKLDILGNPLPKEDDALNIDWDKQKDFEFTYELGLAPTFEVELSDKLKIERYLVKIDQKLTDQYINDIAKQYGKMTNPEEAGEDDILYGRFEELDSKGNVKEDGIQHTSTLIMAAIDDKKIKKSLVGAKAGSTCELKTKHFTAQTDLERVFGIPHEEAKKNTSTFRFTAEKINRMIPAELNQEFFDKIYGPGNVKSEEEFRNKVTEDIRMRFESSTDQKFHADVQEKLLEKLKLSLPDTFLKKWLLTSNEKPITKEQIEEEYEQYAKGLKWQLIENKLIQKYELKVEEAELRQHIKTLILQQFGNMGQADIEEEMLEDTVNRVMQNKDEISKINDQIYSSKLLSLFKEKVKIKEKHVSYDDFVKLAQR
jgi:trigger factor